MSENSKIAALNDMDNRSDVSMFQWHDIDRKLLPFEGRLYPSSYQFQIKPALVKEIRMFSELDENNPMSIVKAFRELLRTNLRILDNGTVISSMNVLDQHQLFFILLIREYSDTGKVLTMKHTCKSCDYENELLLSSDLLQYTEPSEKAWTYLKETGVFEIDTKTHGRIYYKPTTLADTQAISEFVIDLKQREERYESNFGLLFPFIRKTKVYKIAELYQEYLSMKRERFSFLLSLQKKHFDIRPKTEVESVCSSCECGILCKIEFRGGLANIFIANNVDDELL